MTAERTSHRHAASVRTASPREPKPDGPHFARVVIEAITPVVDAGRFPAKATLGEDVIVEADIFTDATDALAAALHYRRVGEKDWHEAPMQPLLNDRWRARFPAAELGVYEFMLEAWIDRFGTWQRDLRRRLEAGQDAEAEYQAGALLIEEAGLEADDPARNTLRKAAASLSAGGRVDGRASIATDERLAELISRLSDRSSGARTEPASRVLVDPPLARVGAWRARCFQRPGGPACGNR